MGSSFLKFKQEKILLDKIKKQVEENLEPQSFAVFDADGTLWPEDVNNLLLDYQETHNLRSHSDLLEEKYKEGKGRYNRCREFASRQEGFSLEEFKIQSRQVLEKTPLQVFTFQKKLLKFLKEKEIFIYVVTASLKWLVEEAVKKYNLPIDKVLGMESHIENGKITSKLIEPLTYDLGKREALLQVAGPKKPLLAAGNSPSDLSLLNMAKISFVVNSADSKNENYISEQKMRPYIKKNKWIVFKI